MLEEQCGDLHIRKKEISNVSNRFTCRSDRCTNYTSFDAAAVAYEKKNKMKN